MKKVKELEKVFTKEQIDTFISIRDYKIEKNKSVALLQLYDAPIIFICMIASMTIAFLIEVFLYLEFVKQGFLIIPTDTTLFSILLYMGLMIPLLAIMIFVLIELAILIYGKGKEKEKEILEKYYEK